MKPYFVGCSVDGCEREHEARGLCSPHYMRWRREGREMPLTLVGFAQAFVRAVLDGTAPREENDCILWPYATGVRDGYARVKYGGRVQPVGHIVLEHFAGPRPSPEHTMGHALHEVCGNRHCVAPEHLSWQTWQEQGLHLRADGRCKGRPR